MFKTLTAVAVLMLLSSCTTSTSSGGASSATSAPQRSPVDASAPLSTSATDLAGSTTEQAVDNAPTIYRGTDRQVKLPPVAEPIRFLGEDVSINFEQAPLSEVMHAILGDILQLDYVVDQPVTGEVTLRTRTPMPRDELFGVLESLLRANNVLMIRGSDGRFLVTGAAQGTKLAPGISNAESKITGFSNVIVPLQYISASNMAEILEPVANPDAFVRVDNTRNLLMLAGTRDQLEGWLEMVATFDVDQLAGMSVGIFPLENSSSDEVFQAISAILSSGGGPEGQSGDWSQLIRVIPIARLNSILVVTPRSHYLGIVQKWIARLDDAYYSEADMRLYVYPVQNTTAERLAKLLNSIYSGSMSQQSGSSFTGESGSSGYSSSFGSDASVAPGMSRESIGSGVSSGNFQPSRNNSGENRESQISTVTMGGEANSLLGNVRVVADEENNALMIYSSGMQYRVIKTALEQLDIEATQVIIEASILEVTLTDKLRYGLEWTFNGSVGDDYTGTGLLTNGATTALAPTVPGFSYAITNSIGDISAVLNALSEDNLINVISTPSVMVLDNHDAYIHVGDQVPVVSAETINDGGFATQTVSYRDTGVQLNVRPSVNAGGLVTMQIEQSVTDVGTVDINGNPTFLERAIMSRVAVRSHESVVLGGLIRENAKSSESGVPILHKLPVIGPLFGTTEKEDTRTELLVIITPRAIYNEQDLRDVSEEMRSQIRHMELIDMSVN